MTGFRGAPGQGATAPGDPAVVRDVRVAAIGVLVLAALSGGSALLGIVAGLATPAARLGGLIGGVIGGLLAYGLSLAGTRLLKFQVRGAHLATRILGVLAVLGAIALFRNIRSGMFIERWPGLLGVLAGLAITIGLIYLQHRAVQALTPAAGSGPGMAEPTGAAPAAASAGAPAAGAGAGTGTATSPTPPRENPYGPPAQSPYGSPGGNPHTPTGPVSYGPSAGPGSHAAGPGSHAAVPSGPAAGPSDQGAGPSGPGYPHGPQPAGPRRTVPLLLIGGGIGAGLIILAVVLVGALIWPGWLVREPVPPEDNAMSTVTVLAEGIESRNAVTLQSVICGDADPYVTAFAQRVQREFNLAGVEGRPTVDGATAEAKLALRQDGQTTVWNVELAPRNARAWCVAGIHL